MFRHLTQRVFSVTTKEAPVDVWQLSFLSGSGSVRSIFRRYAMPTPSLCTLHDPSFVFGDLLGSGGTLSSLREFRKACMGRGTNKVLRMGVVRVGGGSKAMRLSRESLRRELARAAEKKPSVSLPRATCFWAQAVWTGQWEDGMRKALKRPVWNATSWTKVRGQADAVSREMKDLGITVQSWRSLENG